MLDFVFVNPPSPFLVDPLVMPPLGVMSLSSYLKARGFSVGIHDLADAPPGLGDYGVPEARFTCFTATTAQFPRALEVLRTIEGRDTTTVVGGAHASCFHGVDPRGFDEFDVVVVGEGEVPLLYLGYTNPAMDPPQLELHGTPVEDVDSLPFPDRDWPGFERYHYSLDGVPATTAMTSRGCPFECAFCYHLFGRRARLRSAGSVVEEARVLVDEHGIGAIQYYDDTFTLNKGRVVEMSLGLGKLGVLWRAFVHANTVTPGLLEAMAAGGCVEVGMGVESGDDGILRTVRKHTTVERVARAVGWCKDAGIRVKTFLMVGLPGESEATVERTREFLRTAQPDDFDVSIFTPFPKTDIWERRGSYDVEFDPGELDYSKLFYKGKLGEYHAQVSTSSLSRERLEELRDEIEREFKKKGKN